MSRVSTSSKRLLDGVTVPSDGESPRDAARCSSTCIARLGLTLLRKHPDDGLTRGVSSMVGGGTS